MVIPSAFNFVRFQQYDSRERGYSVKFSWITGQYENPTSTTAQTLGLVFVEDNTHAQDFDISGHNRNSENAREIL